MSLCIVGRAKDHALVNICAAGHLRLSDEAPRYNKTSYLSVVQRKEYWMDGPETMVQIHSDLFERYCVQGSVLTLVNKMNKSLSQPLWVKQRSQEQKFFELNLREQRTLFPFGSLITSQYKANYYLFSYNACSSSGLGCYPLTVATPVRIWYR